MSDLISRESLQTAIHNFFNGLNHTPTEEDIQRYIEVAPSAESQGKWIEDEDIDVNNDGKFAVKCSKCGEYNGYRKTNFCPNCGADMRVSEREKKE